MSRCRSQECLIAAQGRTSSLDFSLSRVLIDPVREWKNISRSSIRIAKDVKLDSIRFEQDRYIYSHVTIVSSVVVEANGYYIDPVCSPLVNNNGNAWSNQVLLANFRSFIGAYNYQEHLQIPALSKGKIVDAKIRPVKFFNSDLNKTADVYYVDLLVATDRKHTLLCNDIASGKMSTMSMGAVCPWVQCSCCGIVLGDSDENCVHLDSQLLRTFKDKDGVLRVISELCGRCILVNGVLVGDPNSVKFIEASWVENPAFEGAVLNHFLSEIPKEAKSILALNTASLEESLESLLRTRVADRRGMTVLKVVIEEVNRRKREAMVKEVARTFWR